MHHPRRRLGWLFLALLALSFAAPAPTLAWGGSAHRIIARLAMRQIRREAEAGDRDARLVRQIVYQALAVEHTTLEAASLFPDVVRRQAPYQFADNWHFVSIPRSDTTYDAATQCVVKDTAPEGDCAVGGIAHFRKALTEQQGVANKEALDALSFIIHLVGDLHQPLHTSEDLSFIHEGRPGDRGGVLRPVCFLGVSLSACTETFNGARSNRNLHAIWDKFLILETGKDDDTYTNELDGRLVGLEAATKAAWLEGDPATWAEESHALAAQFVYTPPLLRDTDVPHAAQFADFFFIDRAYHVANIVRVEEQLLKASVRLAHYLEGIAHELFALQPQRLRQLSTEIAQLRATELGPATLSPQIEEVQPVPATLRAGDVLFVPLAAADEAKTRTAVMVEQIRSPPLNAPSAEPEPHVEIFKGAVRTLSSPRTPGAPQVELTLKAVAHEGEPLRYAADRRRFEGTITLGVVNIGGQRGVHRFSEPVVFQVTGPLRAKPELAHVETTAPPYQTVSLSGDSVDSAIEVRVSSSVSPEDVIVKVRVMPALLVDVTPRRIQGWGLETADVAVHARALPPGGNRQVQLIAGAGNLDRPQLTLDADGTGRASIRSASTGKSTVTASGPAFDDATVPVEFVFPTGFLLAGLLGGLAGGSLRIRLPRPGRLGRFFARLGAAVICGFLVLGLYVLGVNVVGFNLKAQAGEVLVFVVAALGALGGVRLLEPPARSAS